MLLQQKQKTFSENFIAFFESTKNSAHVEQKNQLHSLNISEISDREKCGYFNA